VNSMASRFEVVAAMGRFGSRLGNGVMKKEESRIELDSSGATFIKKRRKIRQEEREREPSER
jgi:hypothetical protein